MNIVSKRAPRRRMMADINVVPYIDVMLVLVVILMVSAPFVNPALVELPTVGKASRAPDMPLEITVKADGHLMIRDRSAGAAQASDIRFEDLGGLVQQKISQQADVPVVISGDKSVRYEEVTKVMDALYKLHVRRVGLAVKPSS
jgi:biopolymer transport protein TolR